MEELAIYMVLIREGMINYGMEESSHLICQCRCIYYKFILERVIRKCGKRNTTKKHERDKMI